MRGSERGVNWQALPVSHRGSDSDWRERVDLESVSDEWLEDVATSLTANNLQSERRSIRRFKAVWAGPGSADQNTDMNIKIVLLDPENPDCPYYTLKDARHFNWREHVYIRYRGEAEWHYFREGMIGTTRIPQEADLVVQLSRPAAGATRESRGARAYMVENPGLMSRGQQAFFEKQVQVVKESDHFTAKVSVDGIPDGVDDPKASAPLNPKPSITSLWIHDSEPINHPAVREHQAKELKWNRVVHEVSEYRPGIVLYKAVHPKPHVCRDLFSESDASGITVGVLAPLED